MAFPDQLKAAYVYEKYFFEYNSSSGQLGGLDGKLLQTLAQGLNFSYTLVPSPDSEWGSKNPNGTWSGVIGMILRGEADLAVTYLTATEERMEVVDFSTPYAYTERTFVTNFPSVLSKAFVYVHPFRVEVWLSFFATLMILPLLFSLVTHHKQSYVVLLLELFANVLGMTYFREPRGRLLTAFWRITALLISMYYSALLPSLFFAPLRESSVYNFDDLYKAVTEKGYRVFVYKGSNALDDLRLSKSDNVIKLAQMIEENQWFLYPGQLQNDLSLEGKTAYVVTTFDSHLLYGIPPKSIKFISDDTFAGIRIAVGMSKDFCCKEKLNSAVKNIVQFGLYNKYIQYEIFRRRMIIDNEIKVESRGPVPLTMDHTFGVFVVFGMGHGVSFVVLIIEKNTWKKKSKKFQK